jgi:UDP-glucose 4-epimerase
MNLRTAWVTGAHGYIGRYLCRALADQGVRVSGLGHGLWAETDYAPWGVSTWLNGEIDASNLDLLARSQGAVPDAVFHLAGGSSVGLSYDSPLEDFARTVSTTARLVEWIRLNAADARLVAVSSAAVYGSGHHTPILEDAPVAPVSPYGRHKVMMEQLCAGAGMNFGVPCAIVRLFSVYGPGLKKQLIWDLCRRLAADQRSLGLGGSGTEMRDWIHVQDAAGSLIGAAGHARPDALIINGGTGVATQIARIAELVAAAWGAAPAIRFSGESRAGDPDFLVASVERAAGLGIKPALALSDALPDVVAQYRAALKA